MAAQQSLERKIIMAVDFEIQYDENGFKWGFQIGEFGKRHQWFKLELDPSQSRGSSILATRYPDPNAAPLASALGPEQLVKDYLTALRCHAERVLRHKLPESALDSTPIEFVITVPAVWSDRAQASTRRCAELAGMGVGSSLHIITEPEAAAMYALDAMDPHNIKVGDTFVLCDAGGGTVDLISYKVSALKPTLRIAEAAPGSGSLCGSTILNRIFHDFLQNKLGKDPNWDEDVVEEAMKRFEVTVKRSFNGNPRDEYQIPGAVVGTIFEPVITEVIKLVNDQIDATRAQVKAVLMVGGFSQSVYLRDRIRQSVAGRGIEVMQSPNGWTAVVRGALMKGLASTNSSYTGVKISGRSARKHYGTDVKYSFLEGTDDVGRRFWSPYEGEYMINKMDWFIRKGQTVEENKPKQLRYQRTLSAEGPPPHIIDIWINTCPDTDNLGAPKYKNDRVQSLVLVSADLSRIPLHNIPKKSGADGKVYYVIEYAVEISYYSGYTTYELIHDGVNYGPVAAEYV
ncbi:MAG: hypothetical protein LQ345_007215 [Seirophora villosa]|nr:MAG: hypothetical protein LQ345_007215 [Seirophora villosa]